MYKTYKSKKSSQSVVVTTKTPSVITAITISFTQSTFSVTSQKTVIEELKTVITPHEENEVCFIALTFCKCNVETYQMCYCTTNRILRYANKKSML